MALNVPDQNVLSSPHLQQMMWSRSLLRGYEEAVGDTSNETNVRNNDGIKGEHAPQRFERRELGGLLVQPWGALVRTSGHLDCAASGSDLSGPRPVRLRLTMCLMGMAVPLTASRVL